MLSWRGRPVWDSITATEVGKGPVLLGASETPGQTSMFDVTLWALSKLAKAS